MLGSAERDFIDKIGILLATAYVAEFFQSLDSVVQVFRYNKLIDHPEEEVPTRV